MCSVPRYSASAGREAIELAATAGLLLDPWQCDLLTDALGERPDGKWSSFEVAAIVPRQNGKGSVLEARELAGLFLFKEKLIIHTAHEFKTATEGFRRLLDLITGTDDFCSMVKRVSNGHGEEGIELINGSRIRFLARSKGAGRGFSCDCLILDEAYALTPAQVEAQMPTLSAKPNPQIWYTSSPPLDAVSGEVLIRVRERGESGTDPTLCYYDYGASPTANFDSVDVWRDSNPGFGIRILQETIERERRAMTDEGFGRERLGIWPPTAADAWGVVSEADWLAALDPTSTMMGTVAFAADMSPDRSTAAIAACGKRPDGMLHVEIVDQRAGTGWVVERLKALVATWRPCAVVVDGAGPAGSLIASLEAARIDVVRPSARDAAQACGAFFDAVSGEPDARNLRHLDEPRLATALAGAIRRPLGDAWAWDRKHATVDISPLVAATLAHWGYATRGHAPVSPGPWMVMA